MRESFASLPSVQLANTIDVTGVRAWVSERMGEVISDLEAFVSIETPSTDKECLVHALEWIVDWLKSSIGDPVSVEHLDGGDYGDVLKLNYDGCGSHRVLVLCHYDTVWDKGTIGSWPFQVTGETARGPGVFDMKAGLIQLVWAIRGLEALGLARPPMCLLLNGDEEVGSIVSRPIIECAAEEATVVLVMEPSAVGAVKTARKGVGIFAVEALGIEAHVGLDPTDGASAIEEMARTILQIYRLGDPLRGTTVNVGVIEGGSRGNVTARYAKAVLDVRVPDSVEQQRIEAALHDLAPHDTRIRLTVAGGWNRPVMERTPAITELYGLAKSIAATLDFDLRETSAGGGSDANFLAGTGLPLLDGLGAVGAGAHSRREYINLNAVAERAALTAGLMHLLSYE